MNDQPASSGGEGRNPSASQRLRMHRYAVLVAFATLLLIVAGGLVTSTGSGLAVPDWPLSYGMLFPPMVGGILYEHGHRMVATTVGLLTILLAAWLWRREPRRWVRRLGLVALGAVIAQGLLGGITVLFLLPTPVSVAHACLAQAFFCSVVAIAVVTAPGWHAAPGPGGASPGDGGRPRLVPLAAFTTGVIFVQLLLGAVMRHTGSGLAIPDFPLAFGRLLPPAFTAAIAIHFTHRLGALAVTVMVALTVAQVRRRHRDQRALVRAAGLLAILLPVQILLGGLTIWTAKGVAPTTAHVAVGAFLLGTSLTLALVAGRTARGGAAAAHRGALTGAFAPPATVAPGRAGLARTVGRVTP